LIAFSSGTSATCVDRLDCAIHDLSVQRADMRGAAARWVSYRTLLNLRSMDRALMRKGWTVIERPAEIDAEKDGFLWVRRGSSVLRVPTTIADELVVELLTLSALEATVASVFAQTMAAASDQVPVGWAWSDEGRVWR
jgi:hypothetical protein